MTHLSKKIDKAVFPGEQGGPHVNVFAAMAVAFKLAKTEQFKLLQKKIVENCQSLISRLHERGLRIAYGGSNTHLANIDCKIIKNKDGVTLTGDMAARILDLVGIVTNANTIPGDKNTSKASGIRIGTPWVTQRGLNYKDMEKIADIIADVLFACEPYQVEGKSGMSPRVKVEFKVFEKAKIRLGTLLIIFSRMLTRISFNTGYPFFYFIDDQSIKSKDEFATIEMQGENIRQFINYAFSSRP